MSGNILNETQERRVLDVLHAAKGAWVNGQYFLRNMLLSQYHRAIWNLQHRRERYAYEGSIEASPFVDEYGFKSYRLIPRSIAEVPSKSEPGKVYKVWDHDGITACACPGFTFRGKCSHIEEFRKSIDADQGDAKIQAHLL